MINTKPVIPKGTRDFTPDQMLKRNFIFDTIRGVFQKYGFLPIETPAMENTSTLLGKYGEEGDRLIFKILKRGASLEKAITNIKEDKNEPFAEEALRYDLTVPFARFVVQHQNELTFPFKRYQIQPVWRADRPQKGRYREFYQCDVDVIGSDSLLNEVELIQIMDEVFAKLKIKVTIKINNRKILQGICEVIGAQDKFTEVTIALDKLDKIGMEEVIKELVKLGLDKEQRKKFGAVVVSKLTSFEEMKSDMGSEGNSLTKLEYSVNNIALMNEHIIETINGQKGIEELQFIFDKLQKLSPNIRLEFDPTLARGLNYYTGAIFEVVCDEFPSSICGGGRYDDLTSIFGLNNVSGVGISFGADRIYDVMLEQNLFPEQVSKNLAVLFINFGEKEAEYCLQLLTQLRALGFVAELYPDEAKMKKQMKYANDRGVRKVVMIGSQEMEKGILSVKDMESGAQQNLTFEELIKSL